MADENDTAYPGDRDFEYDAVWCEKCGHVVALTRDWGDMQPTQYECDCTVRSPTVMFPDYWRNAYE